MAVFRNGKPIEEYASVVVDPKAEFDALQRWNLKKSSMGNARNVQGGGQLMFGTPRKAKCRDLKIDGLRIS